MQFRTEVTLPVASRQLSYRKNSLMIGSCFTENIGNHLRRLRMPVFINPCGIVYNPESVADTLKLILSRHVTDESELFFHEGLWNSYRFHGRFSHPEKPKALAGMNDSTMLHSNRLENASHLFVTFGTSWVYREIAGNNIVANCHKMPANVFRRERLTVEEMTRTWKDLLDRLFSAYPELQVVLTISPVRHLKDGNYENQVSKSSLFLLVDNLLRQVGTSRLAYFPSYELVMDELRDYRFFAGDMVHLSEPAEIFIREKFSEVFLDRECLEIGRKIEKLTRVVEHRPLHEKGRGWYDLMSRTKEEALSLFAEYPFIDLKDLINVIDQNMAD